MANPYPAVFRDDNSETRLSGQVDFTDGTNQPGSLNPPVTITETDGTSKGLVISTLGGFGVNALEIDGPHTTFTVDGDGVVTIGSDDTIDVSLVGTGTPAKLDISSTTVGAISLQLSTDKGISVTPGATGAGFYAGAFGVIIDMNAAPADGDLDPGQVALWLDQTNGACKLMVKAKQADGAVKTAAIALS